MNVDANFDIDIDEIWSNLECNVENLVSSEIDNKISDIESPESLLSDYLVIDNPCGIGQTFEEAVWKAVNTRLTVEVKRILRDTLAPDPTQQEIAVAPV